MVYVPSRLGHCKGYLNKCDSGHGFKIINFLKRLIVGMPNYTVYMIFCNFFFASTLQTVLHRLDFFRDFVRLCNSPRHSCLIDTLSFQRRNLTYIVLNLLSFTFAANIKGEGDESGESKTKEMLKCFPVYNISNVYVYLVITLSSC